MVIKRGIVKKEKNMEITSTEVVKRAQLGDEQAFQKLYDLYYKKAYYYALKISNYCEADAEDIVQDTFFEIHRSIAKLRSPEYFNTWLIRIVISKSSRKFRANKDTFLDPEKLSLVENYQEKRTYMVPDAKVSDETDKEIMLSLLAQLKPKQREVLMLQYFEQMSFQEIADVLDIPVGTAKTRAMYARNELLNLVKDMENREQRKLGFHESTFGALLVSAFANEYSKLSIPSKVFLPIIKPRKFHHNKINPAVATAIAITTVCGSVGLYAAYQKSHAPSSDTHVPAFVSNEQKENKQFHPVVYQEIMVTNCRDAYYTLKEWACNEEKVKKKTTEEKNTVKEIYEELKAYEGVYWNKLQKENWVSAFEN